MTLYMIKRFRTGKFSTVGGLRKHDGCTDAIQKILGNIYE